MNPVDHTDRTDPTQENDEPLIVEYRQWRCCLLAISDLCFTPGTSAHANCTRCLKVAYTIIGVAIFAIAIWSTSFLIGNGIYRNEHPLIRYLTAPLTGVAVESFLLVAGVLFIIAIFSIRNCIEEIRSPSVPNTEELV